MQPIIIGSNDKNKPRGYSEHYEKIQPYAYAYNDHSAVGTQQYCPTDNIRHNIKKHKKQTLDLRNILHIKSNTKQNNNNNRNETNRYRTTGIVMSAICIMTLFMNWSYLSFFALIPIDLLLNSPLMNIKEFWYPIAATILGVISMLTYIQSKNIRLYKIASSIGIVIVSALAFKNVIDMPYAIPGFGMIVCLASGIILTLIPFIDCKILTAKNRKL